MVPAKTFDIKQVQKAQIKTPVTLAVSNAQQPVSNTLIFSRKTWQIPIARFTDRENLAAQADTDLLCAGGVSGHLSALRWPLRFFDMAS